MIWLWIGIGLAVVVMGLAGYWLLVVAEGTYLGPRFVALTYDWIARRYDAVKRFVPRYESWFVAIPLMESLAGVQQPLILDVATGTGRLPLDLMRERFSGRIVGLDLSRGMLRQARAKLRPYGDRVSLIWQNASRLPFDEGMFDAVTCLEAVEFLPNPRAALAEMVRVLRPGGVLLVTNRVGREARLLPRRTIPRETFPAFLAGFQLGDVQVRAWQESYDLAIARKTGQRSLRGRGGEDVASLLRCPRCGGRLQGSPVRLACPICERVYPIREGIACLALPDKGAGHAMDWIKKG
jgi:SAM-dependent methyltransferase